MHLRRQPHLQLWQLTDVLRQCDGDERGGLASGQDIKRNDLQRMANGQLPDPAFQHDNRYRHLRQQTWRQGRNPDAAAAEAGATKLSHIERPLLTPQRATVVAHRHVEYNQPVRIRAGLVDVVGLADDLDVRWQYFCNEPIQPFDRTQRGNTSIAAATTNGEATGRGGETTDRGGGYTNIADTTRTISREGMDRRRRVREIREFALAEFDGLANRYFNRLRSTRHGHPEERVFKFIQDNGFLHDEAAPRRPVAGRFAVSEMLAHTELV